MGTCTNFLNLKPITKTFLPPNSKSQTQPLDGGNFASVKAAYQKRVRFRLFDNIDSGAKMVYSVDILSAMTCEKEH